MIRLAPNGRRLFVSDGVSGRNYVLAETTLAARLLEPGAVAASDAQVRDFLSELGDESTSELVRRLRVSRQTLHHWRRRAGLRSAPAPTRGLLSLARDRAILDAIRDGASVVEAARAAGCSESTVRRIARAANVKPAPLNPYPADAELVELARGKTWTDLAAALGRRETAARAWIYARPKLARAVRAVMVRRAPEGKGSKC